jgi:DnaK suppressor protein
MATNANARPSNGKYEAYERALIEQREELRARIKERINEVQIDSEPEDSAGLASDSSTKDIAIATLNRESQTLEEIQEALSRLRKGDYGVCGSCGEPIPDARLRALPWARVCVRCAELVTQDRDSLRL